MIELPLFPVTDIALVSHNPRKNTRAHTHTEHQQSDHVVVYNQKYIFELYSVLSVVHPLSEAIFAVFSLGLPPFSQHTLNWLLQKNKIRIVGRQLFLAKRQSFLFLR